MRQLEALEKLQSLRAAGTLPEEEFQLEKAKILASESAGITPRTKSLLFWGVPLVLGAIALLLLFGVNWREDPSHSAKVPTEAVAAPLPDAKISSPEPETSLAPPGPSEALTYLTSRQPPAATRDLEREHSEAYDECLNTGDAAQGVDSAMIQCTIDEHRRQDDALNAAYRSALQRLAKPEATALRNSQRRWVPGRIRACEKESEESEGGSIWPLLNESCLLGEAIERRLWIEAIPR